MKVILKQTKNKKYKKHDLCVISIENQFLVSFSLDPALYYATPRHNPRSDFFKNDLKSSARLEEKSHEDSARKNNNRLRYNKQCRGGRIPPPALLGLSFELILRLRIRNIGQIMLKMATILKSKMAAKGKNEKKKAMLFDCICGFLLHHLRPN